MGGVLVDYGRLSARTVVTGDDGVARLTYTAPPAPAEPVDDYTVVHARDHADRRRLPRRRTPATSSCAWCRRGDHHAAQRRADARRSSSRRPRSRPTRRSPSTPRARVDEGAPVRRRAASTRGTSATAPSGTGMIVVHEFETANTFTVRLTVTDDARPERRHASQSVTVDGDGGANGRLHLLADRAGGSARRSSSTPRRRRAAPGHTHRRLRLGLRQRPHRHRRDHRQALRSPPAAPTT